MRAIKLFTAAIALLSSLLCVGCDKIKSLADVKLDTNATFDIPVQLDGSNKQSCEFSISLDDMADLDQPLGKPKDLTIKDIELSVVNYRGEEFNGDLTFTIDDAIEWSSENINMLSIDGLSLKSDANIDDAAFGKVGSTLLKEDAAKGCFTVESSNSSPVTASFTVRCNFIINVTLNPLN